MIDIQFGKLFTVELLHAYFANGQCNDFNIVPAGRTLPAMQGYRIVTKQYANVLYGAIQLSGSTGSYPLSPPASPMGARPFITPTPDMQLTFYLQLQHSLFFNYTNLPSSYPPGTVYYFTNRNDNRANGKNFLSAFLAYNNTVAYGPGELATDSSGTVFECIATAAAGVAPSAANSAYWSPVDKNQYASETDALRWMPSLSTWSFTGGLQNSVSVKVWGYNAGTADYTASLVSLNLSFTKPLPSFTLDLSGLSPGKYHLTVKGNNQAVPDDRWIYLDDELQGQDVFAVIDLYNDSGLAGPYQLLNAGGMLLSPVYSCAFLNRSTIWKYVIASGTTGTITDTAGVYKFTTPASATLYSLSPIPLTETALSLDLAIGTIPPYSHIACPSPQRLVSYQPNPPSGDVYSCSEVYLNY
jgi:hypothetical protein